MQREIHMPSWVSKLLCVIGLAILAGLFRVSFAFAPPSIGPVAWAGLMAPVGFTPARVGRYLGRPGLVVWGLSLGGLFLTTAYRFVDFECRSNPDLALLALFAFTLASVVAVFLFLREIRIYWRRVGSTSDTRSGS